MVAVTIDFQQDITIHTDALSYVKNPPAIHEMLSAEDLERYYGVYKGFGGIFNQLDSLLFLTAKDIKQVDSSNLELKQVGSSKLENILENIEDTFNLVTGELAEICQIKTRKTIYNWRNGMSFPHKSTLKRIFALSVVAEAWKEKGFTSEKIVLNKPVYKGKSIIDLLKSDSINKELIIFSGSKLNMLKAHDLSPIDFS